MNKFTILLFLLLSSFKSINCADLSAKNIKKNETKPKLSQEDETIKTLIDCTDNIIKSVLGDPNLDCDNFDAGDIIDEVVLQLKIVCIDYDNLDLEIKLRIENYIKDVINKS